MSALLDALQRDQAALADERRMRRASYGPWSPSEAREALRAQLPACGRGAKRMDARIRLALRLDNDFDSPEAFCALWRSLFGGEPHPRFRLRS